MQPILLLRPDTPGMAYVNGRFVGEACAEEPLTVPVSPRGAVYVEFRPFHARRMPVTKRLALSAGKAVSASCAGWEDAEIVCWPGSVVEMALFPAKMPDGAYAAADANAPQVRFVDADPPRAVVNGLTVTLDEGAKPPAVLRANGCVALTGAREDGMRYMAVVREEPPELLMHIAGRSAEARENGELTALVDMNDTAGHARLMHWSLENGACVPLSSETLWTNGAPRWPETPEDTALCALEAALLGLREEARAYVAPSAEAECAGALDAAASADGCVRLRYPLPDGRAAVGLVRVENEGCAVVTPVEYHAVPMGGPQGMWRLERLRAVTD